MSKLRVVFAGTPDFSLPSLDIIARFCDVLWVYTQPDAPRGRGQRLQYSPVKKWALDHGIPCYQPNRLGKEHAKDLVDNSVDIMIVAAYGQIIPVSVLSSPRYGCLNVHASLLPRWRGASPIQHAILHRDAKTGVCIMQMEKGLDSGAVLAEKAYIIQGDETAAILTDTLSVLGAQVLAKVLSDVRGYLARCQPQNPSMVTYAPKLAKQDAAIDWGQPGQKVLAHIRAYNPWPTAFTWIGEVRIKIYSAMMISSPPLVDAGVWEIVDGDKFLIACADGWVQVQTCQLPGKKTFVVNHLTASVIQAKLLEAHQCTKEPVSH